VSPSAALAEALGDAVARAERLQQMTAILGDAGSVRKILELAVMRSPQILGIERAWLAMADAGAGALVEVHCVGREGFEGALFPSVPLSARLPAALAVRERQAIFVETPEQLRADWPDAAEVCIAREIVAFAALPLLVRGAAIGVVVFSFTEPRPFRPDERAFLLAVAQLCAVASDRESASRTLQQSERTNRVLAEAGAALARSLDEVETVQSIANLAIGAFADWCFVDLRDAESSSPLRSAVGYADPAHEDLAGRVRRLRLGAGYPAAQVLLAGEPVILRDFGEPEWRRAASSEEHLNALREIGPRSLIAVPLRARGEIFGALTVLRTKPLPPYDEHDVDLAMQIGLRASAAIENARLYATAKRDRAAAEEASRAKDQFLAVLGHELRNPLAPIATALRLMALQEGGLFATERATIERQIQHMTRLVDDLLDVSRITRGKVELRRRSIEIADVLARALEIASPALEQRQHRLEVDVQSSGLTVYADSARLAQVFANLLTNAAKYTPSSGLVRVRATRDTDRVRVSVSDTGTGISPELLPHVFDVFVQGARPDVVRGGLGLGLAIVRSLTELHGGRVEVRSNGPGTGSEFIVDLPLRETTYKSVRPTPSERRAVSVSARPRRVLVVDDNLDAAEMLAEWLSAMGHQVRVAADGPTALALAAELKPDVALLDIGLP
ncbi:MAG: ATP-binding protein, partial [Polyangiaceae bacterium]